MTNLNKKTELIKFNKEDLLNRINFDADMISLTDLWKEAGSPKNKRPIDWTKIDSTVQLIETLSVMVSRGSDPLLKTKRGRDAGTYAHKSIALAYAKYLDARLHILVNEIFFQRVEEEKNPILAIERGIESYKKKGYTDSWISKRLDGKLKRSDFTACLAEHGCSKDGFRNATNNIYTPLFGGSTNVVRFRKGIDKKDNIRDKLTEVELEAVKFAETLAKDAIQRNNLIGNARCEMASTNAAKIVAAALNQNRKSIY